MDLTRVVSVAVAALPTLGALADEPEKKPAYTVESVCEGLEVPWDIVFTPGPDARMLITERAGRIRVVKGGALAPEPVYTVPDINTRRGGEIGLMGMCLHPGYATNKFVYIAYAHKDGDIRVVRLVDGGERMMEDRVIIKGMPGKVNHAGCRVGFGPDGKLYVTTGEAFNKALAQDMGSLGGKTLRLNDDGSVPSDNPFVGQEGARPEIWSYGHRNAQGLDWQPGTGLMFQSEHGPSIADAPPGGDEVNVVERGKNYGWPVIHHREAKEGMESPLVEWTPAIAPASGAFYTGDLFPAWKGNFFVGGLGGLTARPRPGVYRIVLDGRKYVSQEALATGYGRIREVGQGPDGALYFTTSNRDGRGAVHAGDDHVFRIVPASVTP